MPTVDHFNKYPPFPTDIPVADLRCLSFSKLLTDEQSESEQLFQSCREIGFFVVDLRGTSEGEAMLKHAETAFDLNKKIHELDQEELNKHALQPSVSLFGFVHLKNISSIISSILQLRHLLHMMGWTKRGLIKSDADTSVPGAGS